MKRKELYSRRVMFICQECFCFVEHSKATCENCNHDHSHPANLRAIPLLMSKIWADNVGYNHGFIYKDPA